MTLSNLGIHRLPGWAACLACSLITLSVPPKASLGQAGTIERRSMFDGKSWDGWRGRPQLDPRTDAAWDAERRSKEQAAWDEDMKKHWSIDNSTGSPEIVSDGEGVFLTTARDYGDFDFQIDWKMVKPRADSGIYLRGSPQVQIWDPADPGAKQHGADRGSGALWNNAEGHDGKWPLALADKPVGEWNTMRIRMVGARVWVWLNGTLTVDGAVLENYWDPKIPIFPRGSIQLQTHGGEIRFRNPEIRSISDDEANEILRQHAGEGFVPLFDGKSLAGWKGPLEGNRVEGNALVSQQGTIFSEPEFGDFVLQLEFALPAGGNNGLAIRFPGEGDGAYDGLCELQILDNDHADYKALDDRQFHGSAYGMVAAHRGYLRPPGQWNHQLVRVAGPRVQVELNGTPILDTDLSTVKTFLDEHPHPGLDRTRGHLGLCGHGHPVRFRRIDVKAL